VIDAIDRGYQLWLVTKTRFSPTERQRLFGLTIAIGGVCGLVAVAFHQSIRWLESLTIDRAFAARTKFVGPQLHTRSRDDASGYHVCG
jgi:hypothetical protein